MTGRSLILTLLLAVTACGEAEQRQPAKAERAAAPAPLPAPAPREPLAPPALKERSGLPDTKEPLSETPSSSTSAQGAADVLQTYYALVEAGKYEEAFRLREPAGATAADLAASFAPYAEHHANVGAPSEIAGAAGSLYVEVPVQIYGRMKNEKPFATAGTVTLRRSNDVPGATAEQRGWRIYGRN